MTKPETCDRGVVCTPRTRCADHSNRDTVLAARQLRREQLAVLLSRAARGVLTKQEGPLLRAAVETELADAEDAHRRAERAEQQAAHVRAECDAIEREQYGQHDEDADGMREAARRIRAALDAAGQLDCPGETDPPTCNCPCEGCQHHCAAHQPDTCRTVDIDGETIRVRGAGDPADTREEASR